MENQRSRLRSLVSKMRLQKSPRLFVVRNFYQPQVTKNKVEILFTPRVKSSSSSSFSLSNRTANSFSSLLESENAFSTITAVTRFNITNTATEMKKMKNPAEWDFCTVFSSGIDIDLLGHDSFGWSWTILSVVLDGHGLVGTLKASWQLAIRQPNVVKMRPPVQGWTSIIGRAKPVQESKVINWNKVSMESSTSPKYSWSTLATGTV